MRHLGDITKINGAFVAPVNVVIGGSPCQDLSIAGRRAGLAGERSGLFMEQLRIIKEMRCADVARGRTGRNVRPRWMVWENVPGAFSSNKGEDFAAVLHETVKIVCPEAPPIPVPGGWPTSGCLTDVGGQWSVAWRVFDAQFWGVPQRRRRIALVADFGGLTAPEILFIRKGVSGDPAEIEEAGKAAASDFGGGSGTAISLRMRAGCNGGGKGALLQIEKSGTLGCSNDQTLFYVEPIICLATQQGGAEVRCDDVAPTLTAAAGMSGNNQPVICMATGQAGAEIMENLAPTLNCDHEQPIILTFPENTAHALRAQGQLSFRGDQDTIVLAFKAGQGAKAGGLGIQEETSPTLTSAESGTNQVPVVLAVDCRNGTINSEINGTLQSKPSGGQSLNLNNVVLVAVPEEPVSFDLAQITNPTNQSKGSEGVAYSLAATGQSAIVTTAEDDTLLLNGKPCVVVRLLVRRLTPLECDRLNGYPDNWTDIGPWVDSKGKFHKESSDSARYKAQGNSIALPSWRWVLTRLSLCAAQEPTMASLFDGIGGFPLIWEQINGKGSCLWASEIEEFPIAVTKYHFREEAVNNGRGQNCPQGRGDGTEAAVCRPAERT